MVGDPDKACEPAASPSIKQYANYLSFGIQLGICPISEVVTWADRLVIASKDLPDWLIELSTSSDKHPLDVLHILSLVPGRRDLDVSMRLTIAKLGNVIPSLEPVRGRFVQPSYSLLFTQLYLLCGKHGYSSGNLYGSICQLFYDLDCVEEGHIEWSVIEQDYEELLSHGTPYLKWLEVER